MLLYILLVVINVVLAFTVSFHESVMKTRLAGLTAERDKAAAELRDVRAELAEAVTQRDYNIRKAELALSGQKYLEKEAAHWKEVAEEHQQSYLLMRRTHNDFVLLVARRTAPTDPDAVADRDIPDPPSVALADRASLEADRMLRRRRTDENAPRIAVKTADEDAEPVYRAHDPEAE